MFYYQKAVGYESSKLWVRIILALGTNHLNFGYESSGYETSVGTKRPDSPLCSDFVTSVSCVPNA